MIWQKMMLVPCWWRQNLKKTWGNGNNLPTELDVLGLKFVWLFLLWVNGVKEVLSVLSEYTDGEGKSRFSWKPEDCYQNRVCACVCMRVCAHVHVFIAIMLYVCVVICYEHWLWSALILHISGSKNVQTPIYRFGIKWILIADGTRHRLLDSAEAAT